jgi:hypothetical protein
MGRRHHNRSAIIALNLLLGWTILGWITALVWSLTFTQASEAKTHPGGMIGKYLEDRRRPKQNFEALCAELRSRGFDIPNVSKGQALIWKDGASEVRAGSDLSVRLNRGAHEVFSRTHSTPFEAANTIQELLDNPKT